MTELKRKYAKKGISGDPTMICKGAQGRSKNL